MYSMRDEKWNRVCTVMGGIFIDLGKLLFGSVVLGSVLNGGPEQLHIFLFGISSATLMFATGILFVSISEE